MQGLQIQHPRFLAVSLSDQSDSAFGMRHDPLVALEEGQQGPLFEPRRPFFPELRKLQPRVLAQRFNHFADANEQGGDTGQLQFFRGPVDQGAQQQSVPVLHPT